MAFYGIFHSTKKILNFIGFYEKFWEKNPVISVNCLGFLRIFGYQSQNFQTLNSQKIPGIFITFFWRKKRKFSFFFWEKSQKSLDSAFDIPEKSTPKHLPWFLTFQEITRQKRDFSSNWTPWLAKKYETRPNGTRGRLVDIKTIVNEIIDILYPKISALRNKVRSINPILKEQRKFNFNRAGHEKCLNLSPVLVRFVPPTDSMDCLCDIKSVNTWWQQNKRQSIKSVSIRWINFVRMWRKAPARMSPDLRPV